MTTGGVVGVISIRVLSAESDSHVFAYAGPDSTQLQFIRFGTSVYH